MRFSALFLVWQIAGNNLQKSGNFILFGINELWIYFCRKGLTRELEEEEKQRQKQILPSASPLRRAKNRSPGTPVKNGYGQDDISGGGFTACA